MRFWLRRLVPLTPVFGGASGSSQPFLQDSSATQQAPLANSEYVRVTLDAHTQITPAAR